MQLELVLQHQVVLRLNPAEVLAVVVALEVAVLVEQILVDKVPVVDLDGVALVVVVVTMVAAVAVDLVMIMVLVVVGLALLDDQEPVR